MSTRAGISVAMAAVALAVLALLATSCTSGVTEVGTQAGSAARTGGTAVTTGTGPDATPPVDRRSSPRGANVALPSITGPITGGRRGQPFNAMPRPLAAERGYVEDEYFISGEATAYSPGGAPGSDGSWAVTPRSKAPYTTRLLVRRPADLTRFDGTVLIEWLNVSSGQDSDVEFAQVHDELMAHGTAWVGVSAQPVGVAGGPSMAMPGLTASPLKQWDPERYAPLSHPGDDYSYDIFSQAGAALLHPRGVDVLAGAPLRALLAAGESQSAARMVTYVDAIHPVADLFDGFLIHSRGDGGAPLQTAAGALPHPAWIRADLDVPVFQFETETDILGLPFVAARQPDTDRLRTWEIAGTSHLDRHLLDYLRDEGRPADLTGTPTAGPPAAENPVEAACGPINDGPQFAVLSKAVDALRAWVLDGTHPAAGPALQVRDGAIARDGHGIALGGVRTPPIDAPRATLRGDNPSGAGYVCSLFGSTTTFDGPTLSRLYPDHATYVDAVRRSASAAAQAGFLLDVDAKAFVDHAERAAS